jgi:hypothetical protein
MVGKLLAMTLKLTFTGAKKGKLNLYIRWALPYLRVQRRIDGLLMLIPVVAFWPYHVLKDIIPLAIWAASRFVIPALMLRTKSHVFLQIKKSLVFPSRHLPSPIPFNPLRLNNTFYIILEILATKVNGSYIPMVCDCYALMRGDKRLLLCSQKRQAKNG